jgi:hypothetical protein
MAFQTFCPILACALLLGCPGASPKTDSGTPQTGVGGGPTSGGGSAGGAAGGSAGGSVPTPDAGTPSGFVLSGTLFAPEGLDVAGSSAVACRWNGTDCDAPLSFSRTISTAGVSAPFEFSNLEADAGYYLVGVKDINGNGDVDPGDYFGASRDSSGEFVLYTARAQNLNVRMAVLPRPQATTPAELVGRWVHEIIILNAGSTTGYTFAADATYTYDYQYLWTGTCLSLSKVLSDQRGALAASNGQLSLTPSAGTYVSFNCNDDRTSSPPMLTPKTFGWRVVTANGSTSLFLTNGTDETEYKKQ